VTPPAYKDVSAFEYLGGFQRTISAKVFCSPYWQEVCCREHDTPIGRKVRIDLSLYPPGGKDGTAMRRCEVCAKWTPPDSPAITCCDCRTEAEEEAFEQRLRCIHQDGDDGLIRVLVRLRWKRTHVRPREEGVDGERPDESAFLPEELQDRQDDSLPSVEEYTLFEQQTTTGRHWLAEVLDMPQRNTTRRSAGAVARAIRRHLAWVAKDAFRRAAGCSVILLPDSDDALKEEIACYKTTGQLMPRAKLQYRVNPRVRYRRPVSRA
jgi:hypothetical protein